MTTVFECASGFDERDHADLHKLFDIECGRDTRVRVPCELSNQPQVVSNKTLRICLRERSRGLEAQVES
jgi:hypothetical protein